MENIDDNMILEHDLSEIRDTLAKMYPSKEEAILLFKTANIDIPKCKLNGAARRFWNTIISNLKICRNDIWGILKIAAMSHPFEFKDLLIRYTLAYKNNLTIEDDSLSIIKDEQDSEKKDFFISYSFSDQYLANWVAHVLKSAKYSVTLASQWSAGSNFVIEISKAMTQCTKFLGILTPSYVESEWCTLERSVALRKDPRGKSIVFVQFSPCELEDIYKGLLVIKLIDYSRTEQTNKLINNLNHDNNPYHKLNRHISGPGVKIIIIAVMDELANIVTAVSDHLASLPSVAEIERIDLATQTIPQAYSATINIVILGGQVGQEKILRSFLERKENTILLANSMIDSQKVTPEEYNITFSIKKNYPLFKWFKNSKEAIDLARSAALQYLSPSEDVLGEWEKTYLNLRFGKWLDGKISPPPFLGKPPLALYVPVRAECSWCYDDLYGNTVFLNDEQLSTNNDAYFYPRADKALYFSEAKHVIVQGDPGSGKSVLLQYMAGTLAAWHLGKEENDLSFEIQQLCTNSIIPPIPILLTANTLASECNGNSVLLSFSQVICNQISNSIGIIVDIDDIIEYIKRGKLWIMVDSLDEVSSIKLRKKFLSRLEEFISIAPLTRITLTSRPVLHSGSININQMKRLTLRPFGKEESTKFIKLWSDVNAYEENEYQHLIAYTEELESSLHGTNLIESPLLLTCTLILRSKGVGSASSSANLYDQIIQILSDSRELDISPLVIRRLLEAICQAIQYNGGTKASLSQVAQFVYKRNPERFVSIDAAVSTIINVAESTGLLRVTQNNLTASSNLVTITAAHRSFQEYLVATDIAGKDDTVTNRHYSKIPHLSPNQRIV